MIIELPYKVDFSINSLYRVTRKGKFLTRKAKEMRARIIDDVRQYENDLTQDKTLKIRIIASEDWICKNGEIRKADLDNRLKFLIDSVFKGLEMDDKYIFEIAAYKKQSIDIESTLITIEERDDGIW